MSPAQIYGLVQLIVLAGVLELATWQQAAFKAAGNIGDPGGSGQYTTDMCINELSNGRLERWVAVFSQVTAELLTGNGEEVTQQAPQPGSTDWARLTAGCSWADADQMNSELVS
jgi:hypothetical protein